MNEFERHCMKLKQAVIPDDEADARIREMLRADNRQRVEKLIESAQLPRRHRKRIAKSECGPWTKTFNEIRKQACTGYIIGLVGLRGTGKTQIGTELIRAYAEMLKPALYVTEIGLVNELTNSFKSPNSTAHSILRKYTEPRLLVIDECGRRPPSDWCDAQLFTLLDDRYQAERDTVLISNETEKAMFNRLGPSIQSRMQECGGFYECEWHSFRAATMEANDVEYAA